MSQLPEDLLRSFELRAAEHAERAQLLSRRLEQNSVTAQSRGGEVQVTVDSTGGLSGLQFGSAARDLELDRLAELVLATSRQAQAKLAESMGELVSDLYGQGSPTATFVTQTYAQRFPVQDDDLGEDVR
ncbi:YbaB/EbfC family nucleoid-associated protein [Krasilnikovia sp. MM14-A1004]|uniref:YbaB/EbfC family nucleoid-associated protein n=1 Tax=Krasilnikovia sp. MM14-A1004 TaxID=3373541 RepID=UPI00399CF7CE